MKLHTLFATTQTALVKAGVLLAGALALSGPAYAGGDQSALPNRLSDAKISLVEGINRAAQLEGFPISAKLEMAGPELHMSVYTAKQGRDVAAEKNDLIELKGDATKANWTPEKEIFADKPHIARAAMHLTVMQQSGIGLVDLLKKAAPTHPGTIYSITPDVQNGKPAFRLLTLSDKGKVTESWLDATGNTIGR